MQIKPVVTVTTSKISPMDRLRETIHENERLNQLAYAIRVCVNNIFNRQAVEKDL